MKISIITINYNNIHGLKNTIQSVIEQTYRNIEYIIIDGGSTDGGKEFIEKNSPHINYWVSEKDKGLYNAMNKGIKKSTGDYLIFMNSGDIFFNKNVLSEIFTNKNYTSDILYGSTVYNYIQGGIVRYPRALNIMNKELPFCHQSCFVKGDLMRKYYYDEYYRYIADYAFFYKCYKEGKTFELIPKIISIYDTKGVSANKHYAKSIYLERCKITHTTPSKLGFLKPLIVQDIKKTIKVFLPEKFIDFIMNRPISSNSYKPLSSIKQL